jgi:hypothetical protein
MVNSDAARVTEFNRGIQSGHVQEAHQESTGSPSPTLLRREKLIPDSMRKTTLKAFRNVFAHHKNNAHAKISDWVSYPRSNFTRKCGHEFVAFSIRKPTRNDLLRHKRTTCKSMDVLTVPDVLLESNAATSLLTQRGIDQNIK